MSANDGPDGLGSGGSGQPRAMIHRKVLDVAAEHPNASLERLAEEVSGASAVFIERVLDEYGDPGNDQSERPRTDGVGSESNDGIQSDIVTAEETGSELDDPAVDDGSATEPAGGGASDRQSVGTVGDADGDRVGADTGGQPDSPDRVDESTGGDRSAAGTAGELPVDLEDLTDRERETLRVIHRCPTASQAEVGEQLGVSRATVSKRVNDIPGFDWRNRQLFVTELFDDEASQDECTDGQTRDRDESAVDDLREWVADIERRVTEQSGSNGNCLDDPELVAKLTHACVDAEYISRDEELRILKRLVGDTQ